MKLLKRLFCKHKYIFIENNYALLGWVRCEYCGKDWGYYNTEFKWLLFKMWLHSLKISIRRNK